MGAKGRIDYSPDQIVVFKETIIEGIYKGVSLMRLLKKNDNLPSRKTVFTWLNPRHKDYDKDFGNNYATAKEFSADVDAEKAEDIYRLVKKGKIEPSQGQVMLRAITWTAGVKRPKKYGAIKVQHGVDDDVKDVIQILLPHNGRGEDNKEE